MRQKLKDRNHESESPAFTNTKPPMEQLTESTIIGPSISVKGELTGEEDLTVQGQVEGQIDLKKRHVTIGRTGCIKADVYGKIITIEGEVQGNLLHIGVCFFEANGSRLEKRAKTGFFQAGS